MNVSPIYAVQKQPSMIDFRGHLTALTFVSGCNLRCGFCHNAALLQKRTSGITWERLDVLCRSFRDNWVDAVTISGGEPTFWDELPELIGFFKAFGFLIKLDTNGTFPEMLQAVLPQVDYVAMDVKGSPRQYPGLVGFSAVERVSQSIDLLRSVGPKAEFRTTVIEGVHDEAAMGEIAQWIRGADRYVLQPFLPHPDLPDPSLREKPRTLPSSLQRFAELVAPHVQEVLILGD